MENFCTASSREVMEPNNPEHISLHGLTTMSLSVDPENQITALGHNSLFHGEAQDIDPGSENKHFLVSPQVTVNVLSKGGSSSGGSGSGGYGTGGDATVSDSNGSGSVASLLIALSEKIEKVTLMGLGRKPVIESGVWSTNSVRSWNPPQQATEGRVNFVKEFRSTPTVMVSINAADVSKMANFRVKVYATAVDLKGFTIHAESWFDTQLYSCGVSWIAIGE